MALALVAYAQPQLASQMMLDLSERVLHLNGTVDKMSGLV
jgi:hypothetical protein